MPGTPMVGVFDTAFHQTMPERSLICMPFLTVITRITKSGDMVSTAQATLMFPKRAAAVLGQPVESLKTIVCHLGSGANVSAVKYGKCIDTSMGLTPLEGLVMEAPEAATSIRHHQIHRP